MEEKEVETICEELYDLYDDLEYHHMSFEDQLI